MPTKEMCTLLMIEAMYQDWLEHLARKDIMILALGVLTLKDRGMRRLFISEMSAVVNEMRAECN